MPRVIAALPLAVSVWATPALAQTSTETPAPGGPEVSRKVERSGTELAFNIGAVVQLKQDRDFRPVPLGLRAGYQLERGLYLGGAGEWSLSLPHEQTSSAFYYQGAGELGYDYSPLPSFGAIPFVRAGYVSTFQSRCADRVLSGACQVTRDAGAIGQLGFRSLFRLRHFESGLEFHYQFGALQNIGFRFVSGLRF